MDIYNRLPQEIQYHIDMILIKKYNQEAILPMIINKRRLILKKYTFKNYIFNEWNLLLATITSK